MKLNLKIHIVDPILIACILLVFGWFYATLDYSTGYAPLSKNDSYFYIFEAGLFVYFCISKAISSFDKNFKDAWKILALFFLIRLILEVKAAIWGISINEKIITAIMFYADAVATMIVTYLPYIKNLKKKWQRSK